MNLPSPPVEMVVPEPLTSVVLYVSVVLVVAGLLWAFGILRREGNPLPLFIGVGGGIASLLEPLYDITAMIWHPTVGQWTAFTLFDRQIPMFIPLAWCWNVGFGSAVFWRCFATGRINSSNIWYWYAGCIAVNALFEAPGTTLGVYTYYGSQPLPITPGLYSPPVGFLNGAAELVVAFTAYRLGTFFQRGWVAWSLGWFITPIAFFAGSGAGWIPVMVAATSPQWPAWATHALGLLSMGLSLGVVWMVRQLLAEQSRQDASASVRITASRVRVAA